MFWSPNNTVLDEAVPLPSLAVGTVPLARLEALRGSESWFNDADKEVEVLKNQIVKTWQNADGEYGEADMSNFLEKMEKDYIELKENLRKQYSE